MTRTEDNRLALLATILDHQVEMAGSEGIEERRLVEVLTTGPGLTARERQMLWLSPAARNAYLAIKEQIVAETEAKLRRARLRLDVLPLVAGGGADVLTLDGDDFQVVAQLHRGERELWVITLRLNSRFRSLLPAMARIRLSDDGDLEWLEGCPNAVGEIYAAWAHEHVSPRERLGAHGLRVELA